GPQPVDGSPGMPDSATTDSGADSGTTDSGQADTGPGSDAGPRLPELQCEVAIVGGGAAGVHTAYRLAPMLNERVCLFEKENRLGGRIYDIPRDPMDPSSPRYGAGALRIMEGQSVVFGLARELGVELQMPERQASIIQARGLFSTSAEAFVPRYPGLMAHSSGDTETALYETLLDASNRMRATMYPDFRSYVRGIVGAPAYDFLRDMSRFRADFEAPLDARGYLDYLAEEWDVCCTPSYPVGGMSELIRRMADRIRMNRGRIFLEEPVLSIESRAGGGYRLLTTAHEVIARKVVIAVSPLALRRIEGSIAQRIREAPEFQAILPIPVVVVTQWWDRAWWRDLRVPPMGSDPERGVWRAWTSDHCVNFVEFPLHQYGVDQRVTRSVYDDGIRCVEFWKATYESGGIAAVEAEVQRGLEFLFRRNGVTMPAEITIPRPLRTHFQYWPDAWHWLRAGSRVTNRRVFEWAVAPLGSGEEVALVGEAYNLNRSGWSDGAYKSSINLLNSRYGFSLPLGDGMPIRGGRVPWHERGK
ncbi:MAG: FAD-dependent oxidoreductase, partial [Sandaracinaceae bacterium]|nr:FAD-dependent oxidoreductase [Sandaracinaceae bacterium]